MMLNRPSQLLLASAASLLAAAWLTACGTLTTDFVFVSSARAAGTNNYGEIDVFEVDQESGHMRQIPSSPFPSAGRNPVAEAVSPDNSTLYVVNRDDNTIVQFVIGSDGKIYPQLTVNTPGVFPAAVTTGGGYLFVTDTYQPLPSCSSLAPCTGSVAVYPILNASQAGALKPAEPAGTLGSPVARPGAGTSYWALTLPSKPTDVVRPTAIATASSGSLLYVAATDTSSGAGYIFGFSVASDGTLTALNGGTPFSAGASPTGIAAAGSSLYATDSAQNVVYAYTIGSNGALTQVAGSPFATGSAPSAVAADAGGNHVFVTNAGDSTLSVYAAASGVLSFLGNYVTGTQPVAVGIDPSLNEYIYTANFLGDNVNGFQLNQTTGALLNSQFSPYQSNANPTAVAAIPHGAKAK